MFQLLEFAKNTIHRKILAGEKLGNHELFTKIFLANSFHIWFAKISSHQIFPMYGT